MVQIEPRLLFGTGVSTYKTEKELLPLIKSALKNGITAFDTAPSYRIEEALGKLFQQLTEDSYTNRESLYIQDKVDIWQMIDGEGDCTEFVLESMKKMSLKYFDCVLIHWPYPDYRDKTLRCLMDLKEKGDILRIGICNVRMRQLLELERKGLLPDVVQIERNPLRSCQNEVEFCLERGIEVQCYSPLCKFKNEIRNSKLLNMLAAKYGKSVGQIVIRWHLDTGCNPIFTSKKEERVNEYAQVFDFKLSEEDISAINGMNIDYKMYLESVACPGF